MVLGVWKQKQGVPRDCPRILDNRMPCNWHNGPSKDGERGCVRTWEGALASDARSARQL